MHGSTLLSLVSSIITHLQVVPQCSELVDWNIKKFNLWLVFLYSQIEYCFHYWSNSSLNALYQDFNSWKLFCNQDSMHYYFDANLIFLNSLKSWIFNCSIGCCTFYHLYWQHMMVFVILRTHYWWQS